MSCRTDRSPRAMVLGATLVVVACGGGGEPVDDDAVEATQAESGAQATAVSIIRGHAIFGHEVRSFRPCGGEPLWVTEGAQLLSRPGNQFERFAVVEGRRGAAPAEGFGVDYPGGIEVEQVLYSGEEGPGCDWPWEEFRFQARGNEPFWRMEVTRTGARLLRPDDPELVWDGAALLPEDDDLVLDAPAAGERPAATLRIRRRNCQDSMSGSFHAFEAELTLADRTYTGCALIGTG